MSKERNRYENIPDELKTKSNWVCYKVESRVGQTKPTKVPYNPITGDRAKANEPTTWTDYETCVAAAERGEYAGIGFEFAPPYFGVDLDHCRDAVTGELEQWAQEIITHLNSYTEASPSGTGIHVICKGTLPPGRRRKGPVEMYDSARFFTVTGDQAQDSPTSVEDRTTEITELHSAVFEIEAEASAPSERCPTPSPIQLGDDEIVSLASGAANGQRFARLWQGHWQGDYDSQSEADQALCCHLAFWAGKDERRIDRLFEKSGLYREKWNRPDYKKRTIDASLQATRETYTTPRRARIDQIFASKQSLNPAQTRITHTTDGVISTASSDFQYRQTDLGNSERFIRQHGNDLRFCVESNTWHIWDGTRWQADKLRTVNQRAKATVKAMYTELATEDDDDRRKALFKHIQKSEGERALSAMVNLSRTDPTVSISAQAFDVAPHLLNCLNGVVDLRTGALLPHQREDLLTKQCPVEFDPHATSQEWEHFLKTCTRGDAELQAFLQRAVGYTLYGDPSEQVILMVHGPGGTGKSTFISAVMAVLGDYSMTSDFSTFLKKDRVSSGPSDDIAALAGARLVASVEVDNGKQLAQALVKQLTGGDVIRARNLYQSSFEFRPQFCLWLVCNHTPIVAHDDDAMWRRILRLPFDNIIPPHERDPNLKAVLTNPAGAARAVLAWAVQGCVEWYRNGLQVPGAVTQATQSYKANSNPLGDFVNEECVLDSTAHTKVSDLRRAYDRWCVETGEKSVLNRNDFSKAIQDIGCVPVTHRIGRVWKGIRLKTDVGGLHASLKRERDSAYLSPFEDAEMTCTLAAPSR
ncbi:MAG: phage/plasmid primase, P4 family [Bryobacteraceae bacterium]